MKYFYIFILLIIFILYLLFKNYIVIEGFSSNKTYILLGDSILKNDAYVKDGNSIEKLLIKHNSEINLYSFAEDYLSIKFPIRPIFESNNSMLAYLALFFSKWEFS